MPTHKDFKRLVRTRMGKTGESYTSARANLLRKRAAEATTAPARPSPSPTPAAASAPAGTSVPIPQYAQLGGMSDEALKKKTGCTWEKWVKALDHVGANQWPHGAIAEYVHDKYKIDGWWAQTVTVGYERIRGLRERGQQRDGAFRTSTSRTVPVSLSKLYRAFSQPRLRSQWLDGVTLTVRKATPSKYVRITWGDGTSVDVGFTPKERSKSRVAVEHGKLPSREAAGRMKRFWSERLAALTQLLAPRNR